MMVLNLTPDSFSDGGDFYDEQTGASLERVLRQIETAVSKGFDIKSDILDIGGESTRPGAKTIEADIECGRILPAIEAIRSQYPTAIISVDTRKAQVVQEALNKGASIVNDVSGLQFDSAMAPLVAASGCTLVLMHSIGTPETMQAFAQTPEYYPNGVVQAVIDFFEQQLKLAQAHGIQREQMILDPGFGFGKTIEQNLTLHQGLTKIKEQFPENQLLVGTSRKSFLSLGKANLSNAEKDMLSAASVFEAIAHGKADIVRIHQVSQMAAVIHFADAYRACTSHLTMSSSACPAS